MAAVPVEAKTRIDVVNSMRAHTVTAGSNALGQDSATLRRVLSFVLILFLVSCVFDPADKLLGLKVQLFALCWFVTFILCATSREKCGIHLGLLVYTLLFILVPVLSIAWYWAVNGGEPFKGFQLLKGYILVTLGPLLFVNRINLLPQLAAVLTILAVAIILVFLIVLAVPDFYSVLHVFGNATGIVLVDNRDYGSGLVLLQIYFVTSPMLAISIAHYFQLARSSPHTRSRIWFGVLTLINICAMMLAGSRNNIATAILLTLVLLFLSAKHKILSALVSIGFAALLLVLFFDEILVLLDPAEISNSIKLSLLDDYGEFFGDPIGLLFGQGLGAYQYWAAKGSYFYISELTYLELIRNFGAFGAMLMLGLLLFPLIYALFVNRAFGEKHVVIGYAFYLVMCISNPNLFSSLGILILSVLLANIFLFDYTYKRLKGNLT